MGVTLTDKVCINDDYGDLAMDVTMWYWKSLHCDTNGYQRGTYNISWMKKS